MADEIKMEVEALYTAGKVKIPAKAQLVADAAERIADALGRFQGQAWAAGNPSTLMTAISMDDEVYTLLRRAVQVCNDISIALVATADAFVATDADAAAAAQQLQSLVQKPLETVEVPPTKNELGS